MLSKFLSFLRQVEALAAPDHTVRQAVPFITLKVDVKMRLELRETITRELMWSKTLTFTEFDVPLTSVLHSYASDKGTIVNVAFTPEANENIMAKEMEKQYPVLMATIYTLIDPEEMTIIKKQAQEVKTKEPYNVIYGSLTTSFRRLFRCDKYAL